MVNQVALSMTPGALELLGDAAAVVLANDVDDLVCGQRAGSAGLHHQPSDRPERQERADQHESEQRAERGQRDRRGFFGFLRCGGLSLGVGSGLLARRNRLARARGGSPPLLGGALMPFAGLPLVALSQGLGSVQGLPGSAPDARTQLYMTADRDEMTIREAARLKPPRGR